MRQDSQEEPLKTQLSGAHRVHSYLIGKEAQWAQLSSIWTPMAKAMPLQWTQAWYLNHGWLDQICMWPCSKEASASEGPGRISAQQGHSILRDVSQILLLGKYACWVSKEKANLFLLLQALHEGLEVGQKKTPAFVRTYNVPDIMREKLQLPCCIHDVTSVRTKSQQAMHSWVKGWEEPCWCYYWAAEPILAII